MITRRDVLALAPLVCGSFGASGILLGGATKKLEGFQSSLRELEKQNSGRLGVALLFTDSGVMGGFRIHERFPMCSTFKVLLAATILDRADSGRESLRQSVAIPTGPLLGNSPLTEEHTGSQMALRDLCRAVIVRSDNTAANLLLTLLGGPEAISRFARLIGDPVTRLDRTELALNEAIPGDQRDTTSPAAMIRNLEKLLLGDILSPSSRNLLTRWMIDNQTGNARLRAGFPPHWRIGDKTGSNAKNTTNDIAIVWPDTQAPILITAYLTECAGPEDKRNAVLAQVAHLATKVVSA